jgi:hypothetical protein
MCVMGLVSTGQWAVLLLLLVPADGCLLLLLTAVWDCV